MRRLKDIERLARAIGDLQQKRRVRMDLLEADDLADKIFGAAVMSAADVRRAWLAAAL